MYGFPRLIAVAAAGVMLAGCMTDGLTEADGAAKPRVIDTPKTLPQSTAAKPKPRPAKPEIATAQGDGGTQVVALRSERDDPPGGMTAAKPRVAPADAIPAQSLFGNWTLATGDGSRHCSMILGGVVIGTAYSARGGSDCPGAFASVQSWEIQGDELILRNPSRGIVGRLQPTGPSRFDGQAQDGGAFYLVR
ncbi:MAG: AprI/Inh family metalloprotease inhibitor [Bradyrhizobiaceae bacterium]|nr:AprI/Inh family metalloprotease inhibitor [Bradyrhizobiaceae bacterium]